MVSRTRNDMQVARGTILIAIYNKEYDEEKPTKIPAFAWDNDK